MSPRRLQLYALLLFTASVWGGSFVAARMVLHADRPGMATLSPTLLATVRFLLASAVFAPILYRQHARVQPLRVSDLPVFLLAGQLSISAYFWLQYTGVQLTSAGVSSVLVVGLIPLATMLISRMALGEPLGARRTLALAAGLAGVVIVVSQKGLDVALESGFLLGVLCLLSNAACFGVYSTLVRGIRARYSSVTVTAATMVSGALGLALVSVFADDWTALGALALEQWAAILYLAVACSVLAYFFYNYALTQMEATKAAAWLYLEPPVAVLLGALLLGEPIAVQTVLGGLVILAGLYLTQKA